MAEQYSVVDARFHVLVCHTYHSFVCLCILLWCICACVIVLWRNFRVVQKLRDHINRSSETVIIEHFLFVQFVNSIVASKLVPTSHSLQECFVMLVKWITSARTSFRIVVILVCQ